MEALTLLNTRTSRPLLHDPAPDPESLHILFQAALRAPDHAQLRPWRFLTISGDARGTLGELFVRASQQIDPGLTSDKLEKISKKPFRAPLIIVVVAVIKPHPKVPESEQMLSAGAAAQNILLGVHAQGYGAIWRTGGLAYNQAVKNGLGLADNEQIIGFIYVGTVKGEGKKIPDLAIEDFVVSWTG